MAFRKMKVETLLGSVFFFFFFCLAQQTREEDEEERPQCFPHIVRKGENGLGGGGDDTNGREAGRRRGEERTI